LITVKCVKCKSKVFKYNKIGKGRLMHCWHNRIIEDYSVRNRNEIKCKCGALIGVYENKWVKMKQSSFACTGVITKK
jgi:hypothetical protein